MAITKNYGLPEISYKADDLASTVINPICNITWQGDAYSGCNNQVNPNIWVNRIGVSGGCGSDN